ncbi:type II restriction enzyme, methylase [unidentified eubacterium SCB49]|nr:type II restriction enzyme, methylase [unidentified eubacterium SCB49]
MALYQVSVLKQHITLQDKELVDKAYKKYTKYFLNPTIQDNIRSSKEEEYQGIFLTELFVKILGYTLKPNADFNLVAEYKNQTNARKADGAILHKDVAIGVIELKGTNTKDLESIRKQAFDYKANQKGCVYVITSNFEKLRFYINDATEFEEFNLFELSPERFELLYLCLQKDNIINNVPLKIKEASVVEEEQITKQFYKDYSVFKRELYRDLVKRNAKSLKAQASSDTSSAVERSQEEQLELQRLEKNVKLTLFKKSQKLIDRYLFIFFAEDRGLLPANSTQQILDKWKDDVDFGDDRPLYTLFKQYFNFLDQGRAGTAKRAEIYAYNGGLFKEDKTLDSLDIDSDLLYKHTSKLAAYDFESQVDVNILGHIFENSLNEIESVNAEIEGGDFDKQKSKRKKDGVFYTPKYITKYIVENTIGKLCDEKKTELGFKEEEYFKGRKNRQKATITKLVNILDTYRDWLLQLTICDPACGSGAFLNQALDFLIKEHSYIDELKTKVLGGGLQFSDIENTILENNIYGVDLNEESVEIAKLSLWLRTAQPRRKLNNLNSNIKCGNSLIDSKTVAGDKAFNWEEQFPKVFDPSSGSGGGFDVVIGNPPYVRVQNLDSNLVDYYFENYKSPKGKLDLSILFFEKVFSLIKTEGKASFISSSQWMQTDYGENIRNILSEKKILEIINFGSLPVFENVETYPAIFFLTNNGFTQFKYREVPNKESLSYSGISNSPTKGYSFDKISSEPWQFSAFNLIEYLNDNNIYFQELKKYAPAFIGCLTGMDAAFVVNAEIIKEYNLENEIIIPYAYRGQEISRYSTTFPAASIIYPYHNENGSSELFEDDYFSENFPNCYNYLSGFKEELKSRKDSRKNYAFENNFFRHLRAGSFNYIMPKKLVLKGVDTKFTVGLLDNNTSFNGANTPALIPETNSDISIAGLISILNSTLITFYLNQICPKKLGGYYRYNAKNVSAIPIIKPSNNELSELGQNITNLSTEFNLFISKTTSYLISKYNLSKISRKLENWQELEFGDFIKELNKSIKANNKLRAKQVAEGVISSAVEIPTLTKKDEFEWLDLFEENKQKAQALQTQINQTDAEIDAMVYELYGLTEEEIAIVENS